MSSFNWRRLRSSSLTRPVGLFLFLALPLCLGVPERRFARGPATLPRTVIGPCTGVVFRRFSPLFSCLVVRFCLSSLLDTPCRRIHKQY
jgi:hypothetical protein